MKTEELVTLLASGLEPVDQRRTQRLLPLAWVMGMAVSMLLVVGALRTNAALPYEVTVLRFWIREAFCTAVALATIMVVGRLAQPGTRLGLVPLGIALPVLSMWLLAAVALVQAPPNGRGSLILGRTALICPWLIAFLSAPLFLAMFWALRKLAPTQLRLAGAATGLAAGAGGALVYTLHCPEFAAPFLGLWYVLGMLIPAGLGAVLGPRLLRW